MTINTAAERFNDFSERIAKLDYPVGTMDKTEARKIDLDLKNAIVFELRILSDTIEKLNITVGMIMAKMK